VDPVLLKIVGINLCLFLVVAFIDLVVFHDDIEDMMGIMYDFWGSATVSSTILAIGYIVFFLIA